jgi:hypothetical protein
MLVFPLEFSPARNTVWDSEMECRLPITEVRKTSKFLLPNKDGFTPFPANAVLTVYDAIYGTQYGSGGLENLTKALANFYDLSPSC